MEHLQKILFKLKDLGCSGVKISYEDEGALLNEIINNEVFNLFRWFKIIH